jgi:hypothetical protein
MVTNGTSSGTTLVVTITSVNGIASGVNANGNKGSQASFICS